MILATLTNEYAKVRFPPTGDGLAPYYYAQEISAAQHCSIHQRELKLGYDITYFPARYY
jgi:hypothetical protein